MRVAHAEPSATPRWRHVGATPSPGDGATAVAIVGGGPVGLTLALDLGRRGHRVVVLNRLDFVAAGSKAICFAKRSLEIWDRLGVGEEIARRGVTWNVGKVFWGDRDQPVYQFDLLPLKRQKMPAFVNLQQYHVEEVLIAALSALPNVELRWRHEVTGVRSDERGATLDVRAADGNYALRCDWLCACDGARSPIRSMLGLGFAGRVFEDNFLIADIRMDQDRPAERWFWFDPPFNPGRSALLHKQPDGVWRLDFQLGWGIDREAALRPDHVAGLVRGMLGEDVRFDKEWYSVYTFQCRRMERFVHGRTIFAGDSAHLLSPFGARGCNGGVADADNLGWKLDLAIRGDAPATLLDAYDYEATMAADANIEASSRSTDFMTPRTPFARALRDAVLELSATQDFARAFVNSGRLSVAPQFPDSPLTTGDGFDDGEAGSGSGDDWAGVSPGSAAVDAPIEGGWLLERLGGDFVLLTQGAVTPPPGVRHLAVETLGDVEGLVARRYDLRPGTAYLLRPDQYVAARWRHARSGVISAALDRVRGWS